MKNLFYYLFTAMLMLASVVGFSQTNPVIENIFNRKSVRAFTSKPVDKETLTLLVKAGMAAPSGMDRRPWDFVISDQRDVMESLAAKLPCAKMLKIAQAAIIIYGNPDKSTYWYLDCSAAAQNILLAAESLGLGAVWTAAYPDQKRVEAVNSALKVPSPYIPLCVIPIGYPSGNFVPKDKWDPTRVHFNLW